MDPETVQGKFGLDIRLWYTEGETEKTSDGSDEFVFKPGSGIRCSTKHGPALAAAILELSDVAKIDKDPILGQVQDDLVCEKGLRMGRVKAPERSEANSATEAVAAPRHSQEC